VTAIQPCALLLLVGPDWRVETASANVAMLGDTKPSELVGQPLTELIGSKAIHSLRNRMSWLSSDESEVHDFGVQWGDVTLDVRAIQGGNFYLIEAELAVEPRLPDAIGMVRSMTDRLVSADPHEMAEQAMRQLCSLTGFARLTLCDRQGRAIATGEHNHAPPFAPTQSDDLGSVPKMIADRDAEPVALLGEEANAPLDRAAFLAPDDIRRDQLANLGIAATMSLPLRIDGEWVGTVEACHPEPRRCGAERRAVAHLFAERLVARMARHGWRP